MNLKLFSFFVLAGLLLNSCAVDELPAEGGSIVAEMETDQTKTSVTDEGTFTWSNGDQVWLHTTSGSVVGTLSSGAGTSSAQFTYGAYFGSMTGKAVYPYNAGHAVSENELSIVLPSSYDLGSSLTNTNAAMYGVNVGGTIKFNHLAGVMRFKFKDVPAGVNKFTITLDKKINGTFTADLTADYPVIETSSSSTAAEKTITLNFNALTAKSDICVYVPLPIGTYNSLELGLYDESQSVWTYSNTVTNTISRKTLKLMPTVTLGGSIGGEIEGDDAENLIDYIDEYGENHGPGVKIGETVWAPVNCGYHKTDFKYGKLYQWGRKYGQGYSGGFHDGESESEYSDAILPDFINGNGKITIEERQSENNANVFYLGGNMDFDWLYPHDGTLWNKGTDDSPQKNTNNDPCPQGWRVPTYAEYNTLIVNRSSWTKNEDGINGYYFSGEASYSDNASQIFIPAAGSRVYYDEASCYNRGKGGRYWASRSGDQSESSAYYIYFDRFEVYWDRYDKALGYSVRCVQLTDEVAEL